MEGRGKIAFDPRDFQDGGESKQVPKLTLLEEVLLLGLKDNQVSRSLYCVSVCTLLFCKGGWMEERKQREGTSTILARSLAPPSLPRFPALSFARTERNLLLSLHRRGGLAYIETTSVVDFVERDCHPSLFEEKGNKHAPLRSLSLSPSLRFVADLIFGFAGCFSGIYFVVQWFVKSVFFSLIGERKETSSKTERS